MPAPPIPGVTLSIFNTGTPVFCASCGGNVTVYSDYSLWCESCSAYVNEAVTTFEAVTSEGDD